MGLGHPRSIPRRYTRRQIAGYAEALAWKRHDERRFRWDLTRAVVAALGGELAEFPDYVAPEEGEQSWEAIEADLDAFLGQYGGAFMFGGRRAEAPQVVFRQDA